MTETFGPGRLLLADTRLAFALLNEFRYRGLERAFGTSRQQANVLTFVLAVGALDLSHEAAKKVLRLPRVTGTNAAMGGFALREGALGVLGPGSREVPLFGTLVTAAIIGRLGLPTVRRAAHELRGLEHRVRTGRIERYLAAVRGNP